MLRHYLWLYLFVLLLSGTRLTRADTKGELLLQHAETLAHQARTLQATAVRDDGKPGLDGMLRLMKPGLIYYVVPDAKGHRSVIVSQGSHLLNVNEADKHGTSMDIEALYEFGNLEVSALYISCFLEPTLFRSFTHPAFAGTSKRQGVTYQTVKCPPSYGRGATTFYIGPSGLPEGIAIAPVKNDNTTVPAQAFWLRNLRLNAPLAPAQFAYTPPASVHIEVSEDPALQFLAPGDSAPAFDLPTPTGARLSLASLLKGHKAVLLNFTFAECGACLLELPILKKLHDELKDRGLAVVAINITDDKEEAGRILAKYHLPYPMGLDSEKGGGKDEVRNGYHADVGGANYLISAEGKVLWRCAYMNEVRLRSVLEHNHIPAFAP